MAANVFGFAARSAIGATSVLLASEMLANSGQVFNMNPALVAWLPALLLLLVTAFALGRVR